MRNDRIFTVNNDRIVFASDDENMTFSLYDDCIVVEYDKSFAEKTPIFTAGIFILKNGISPFCEEIPYKNYFLYLSRISWIFFD